MKIVCLWGKGGVCSFFYKFNLLIHRIAKREAMKKLNRVISQPLFFYIMPSQKCNGCAYP